MKIQETSLKGNYLIDIKKQKDERGFFARFFCKKYFLEKRLNTQWVQINSSMSKEIGTLRGLHFQKSSHAEVKLVRCIRGMIWDVVVDLRKDSNTFGKWFGAKLSEENQTSMYVPKGFAHGFISLTKNTEIFYLVSNFYAPEAEETLLWNDSELGISWPIKPSVISKKDLLGKRFKIFKSATNSLKTK
jgi:dTDP-4-dehydrorhamnose 3,5-epimerase